VKQHAVIRVRNTIIEKMRYINYTICHIDHILVALNLGLNPCYIMAYKLRDCLLSKSKTKIGFAPREWASWHQGLRIALINYGDEPNEAKSMEILEPNSTIFHEMNSHAPHCYKRSELESFSRKTREFDSTNSVLFASFGSSLELIEAVPRPQCLALFVDTKDPCHKKSRSMYFTIMIWTIHDS